MSNLTPGLRYEPGGVPEKLRRVSSLPTRIRRRKVLTDVAGGDAPQERVGQRMQSHIRV